MVTSINLIHYRGPALFYILYGEDDFTAREALAEIKGALGDEVMLATNTTVFQGGTTTPEELAAACNTIPFLAANRLVIIEGLLGLFEPQGKGKTSLKPKDSGWFALKKCVEQMPASTVLVTFDGKLKKSNPLLGQLAPKANVREFAALRGDQLYRWIQERVKKCGGEVSPPAVRLLANLVGNNLWILSSEIEKLCLYALGRTVDENDVMSLVVNAREFTVFDMVDALLERKTATATRLLHQLEDEGMAPPYLLFMITRQFRLVIQAKDMLQQKSSTEEIKRALDINHDFVLRKTLEQAQRHSMQQLKVIYTNLLDTDIAIKTGKLKGDKGELALDLLISELR